MYDVLKEIVAYVVFLFILMVFVYCNQNSDSFYLQKNLRQTFLDKTFEQVIDV